MSCAQSDSFTLVLISLLAYVCLPVTSYQENHRHGHDWTNHIRHHHVHWRSNTKEQVLPPIGSPALDKVTGPTAWMNTFEQHRPPDATADTNRRVEAVHAFQGSSPLHNISSTSTPQKHKSGISSGHWHHERKNLSAKAPILATAATSRPENLTSAKDEYSYDVYDYYYYDENNSDYAPAAKNVADFRWDDEKDRTRTITRPKSSKSKHQATAPIDDYTFDYLEDDPVKEEDKEEEKFGVLTEEKWKNYGTAEAVENSRKRYMSEAQKVSAHITRVHLEAMCKNPRPKIIQISDASKRYVPHCTVLHRCGDDTGCCHSDIQSCIAKKTVSVDLYFYVIPFGSKEPVIEMLSFINHTECHCVEKQRRTTAFVVTTDLSEGGMHYNNTCACVKHFTVFQQDAKVAEDTQNSSSAVCRCDCLSENQTCLRLKKGFEGFSVDDRRCISDGRCSVPVCQFGEYNTRTGRCPRSHSKRMAYSWSFK